MKYEKKFIKRFLLFTMTFDDLMFSFENLFEANEVELNNKFDVF